MDTLSKNCCVGKLFLFILCNQLFFFFFADNSEVWQKLMLFLDPNKSRFNSIRVLFFNQNITFAANFSILIKIPIIQRTKINVLKYDKKLYK